MKIRNKEPLFNLVGNRWNCHARSAVKRAGALEGYSTSVRFW